MPPGGGSSTTTSVQELSPEQKELMAMVIPMAKDYLNTPIKQGPSTYVGLNDREKRAQELALKSTGDMTSLTNKSIQTAKTLQDVGSRTSVGGQGALLDAGRTGAGGLGTLLAGGGASQQGLGQILGNYTNSQGSRDFLQSGALLDPRTNPVLKAQISGAIRPVTENLQNNILPGIKSDFTGGNAFGSSRQGIAEGLAIKGANDTAGDIAANLQANNFNQGLGALLSSTNNASDNANTAVGTGLGALSSGVGQGISALGTATNAGNTASLQAMMQNPQLLQGLLMPSTIHAGVGAQNRGAEQARLQDKSTRMTNEQLLPFMQAQDVASLAFGMPGGSATTTTAGGQSSNPFMSILGGVSMLAPWIMASDRRAKMNIVPLEMRGRYQWYEFEYISEPGVRVKGVMADEVEKINPDAVRDIAGFKMVNYSMLDENEREAA